MRILPSMAAGLLLAAAGGCVPSQKLAPGELDGYWYLHDNVFPRAEAMPLALSERKLPARWVFRREDSLIWSTVSIVRAIDKLAEGADEIEVSVSPAHAEMLAQILAEGRQAVLDLKEIADPHHPPTPKRWAAAVAHALTLAEHVARVSSPDPDRRGQRDKEEPMGWSAGPMLEMAIAYLNERSGGHLLAGVDAAEAGKLREVLAQMVLRLGFAVAGKQEAPGLRKAVSELMRRTDRLEELEKSLGKALLAAHGDAAPAPAGGELRSALGAVFSFAPPMFEVLASAAGQWNRMESIELEFRRWRGQPIIAATLSVAPRREARVAKLFFMQPAVVFRGKSRLVVLPKVAQTGETVVLFEPAGGATEVRFEGLGYGLVRLVAVPLASGTLREVRVATAGGTRGPKMVNVALLMEAAGDRKDPRRLIAFQDVRRERIVREAFGVRTETLRKEQTFNYLTPARRYTYRRLKGLDQR